MSLEMFDQFAPVKQCACGVQFEPTHGNQIKCPTCREGGQVHTRACVVCGNEFEAKHPGKRYCSLECRKESSAKMRTNSSALQNTPVKGACTMEEYTARLRTLEKPNKRDRTILALYDMGEPSFQELYEELIAYLPTRNSLSCMLTRLREIGFVIDKTGFKPTRLRLQREYV